MPFPRAFWWSFVFAVTPLIHSYHINPTHNHHHTHLHASRALPSGWTSQGCYLDNVGGSRTLQGATQAGATNTVESCVAFCISHNFIYAGVEYGQECYCDNLIGKGASGLTAASADCNMPCSGDASEMCGAGNRLNVYWSGATPPAPPTTKASVGLWVSLGCYSDNNPGGRTLTVGQAVTGQVTIESCTTACFNAGYPLAGTEYSAECYCGSTIAHGGAPTPIGDCSMTCSGDTSEFCGGPNRLNLYNFTSTLPNPAGGGGGGGGGSGSVSPVTSGLPSPWTYSACYVDNAHGRAFATQINDNSALTVESCINTCAGQGFTLAGMEFSVQCFCGNTLIDGAVVSPEADCNMACGGSATEACGGPNRLSVYTSTGSVTALPAPVTQTTGLPGQWTYHGCFTEPNGARMFPYQNIYTNNNSVTGCLNQCAAFGYPAGGMEFGQECYCGDVSDIATGTTALEQDCSIPCSGDPIHLCGGALKLSVYTWNGNMQTWHTPANTGHYQFLIGGVVVPLVATVGINNKVSFLEKGGTGFANSTGAYELDLSLLDNFSAAWRTMHIKSDVFCSASIVLPDKAARIINIGGWSLDSTFGIRLYSPDGSPGVASTNDWEENFNELKLQRGRWYPSALVLANGTILVVGGEAGSNGTPVPSLELLPTPAGGDTVITLDYLLRTDPNNLYPFLFVLPSGNVFIIYYNEARILDATTFNTITQLPNIPAAVNNFMGGRTYPLEGAAVLLPQSAPYTDPITVLVCGGSNSGAGVALDNCVHIQPEVPGATWVLERMPSKRVMPCMAALPDGTFMILNGAHQGYAGFGLANDPNLNALLYDPSQPVNSRISILGNTIVARLYHSEATLLPDGRVLVSGSDPQTADANGNPIYPEEFRLEVYVPPYLTQGFTQPSFTITNTDWAYGGQFTISVTLHQGTTSTMKVSLVGATSSTHGNTMGGRTIFPAFTCAGTTCTITAPPNNHVSPPGWHQLFILDGPTPSHSHWVRIGGDPASLGNWPNFPDFHLPGV